MTSQLCALADVQAYIGAASANEAPLLTSLITNASAMIESYCGRTFAQQAYMETRNGNGADRIFARELPIVSVESVSVDGIDVPQARDTQSYGYAFDDEIIYLRGSGARGALPRGVYPAGYPGRFLRGMQNVVLNYTAGFAVIPPDVAQACIELVAWKRAKALRIDKKAETLGQQQTAAFDLSPMPQSVAAALKAYRIPMVAP